MQENLGFPNPSAMAPDRAGEDDAASLPTTEEDARSGDTVVLGDDERECVEARFYNVQEELDQPTTVANPAAKEIQGTEPLENIATFQAPQEGSAEHVPSASQAELLAAGTPELFTTPTAGEHFGTYDIPLTKEGVDFDFAPPVRETAETISPTTEEDVEVPLDQGEQQDKEFPQGEEGAQRDVAPPPGPEEGMGETEGASPSIVNLDSEGEGEEEGIPPLRNRNLQLTEGDGGSGNDETRVSTLPLDVPVIQTVKSTQPPPINEEIGVEEIDEERLRLEWKRKGKDLAPPE